MSGSTVRSEEKMLRHLFLSQQLSMPQEWYFQIYSDEPKTGSVNHELSLYTPLGQPIRVKNWNILNGSVTATTVTRPAITNANLVIFPLVPEEEVWRISFLGLWVGRPEETNSYLFYYRVLEEPISLTAGQQFYISPGELVIYYGCST